MRHPKFRHIAAAGALALSVAGPLAACGDPSLSPRPAQAAGDQTSAAASHLPGTAQGAPAGTESPEPGAGRQAAGQGPVQTTTVRPPPKPTTPRPTSTKPTDTCYGAVRHDLDLRTTELALVKSMCFHTGGILRLQGIGPGMVTATPADLVSQSYEGGVVDLRFVRPGTVTVSIPQDEQTYTITVVVVS
jgi:hypothetical protein